MELVTPGIGLIFWSSVTFIFLLILLKKFAWKPILSAVKSREESIQNALQAAENARKELQNLTANNERILNEARQERDKMLAEAKKTKESIVFSAKEESQIESQKLISQAKSVIEQEKQEAIKTLRTQVVELSLQISEKILADELSDKDKQQKKVENLLKDISLN